MNARYARTLPCFVVCILLAGPVIAADWRLVDDFESYGEDISLSSTAKWASVRDYESATLAVLDDGNRVAQVEPGQALVTNRGKDSVLISEGGSGTIFFKFRTLKSSKHWGGVFGMASEPVANEGDVDACWLLGRPDIGPRPNATLLVPGGSEDLILVNNRGSLNRAYEGRPEIKPNVWYSVWVTIDNSRDEIRMYIQGGDFEKRTVITESKNDKTQFFPFQKAGAMELRHLVIASPLDPDGKSPRTIQVDDINFMSVSPTSAVAGAQ